MTGLYLARCDFAAAIEALTPPQSTPLTSRQVWDEFQIDGRDLSRMVAAGEITRDGAGSMTMYHGVQAAVAARLVKGMP